MIKPIAQAMLLSTAAWLLTACATERHAPEKNVTDKVATEKSKAYVDHMSFVLAGSVGGGCKAPSASQRASLSSSDGPSKEWKDLLQNASSCAGEKKWKTLELLGETMARTDINAPWGPYFLSVAAEGTGEWQRALWMIELAQKKAGEPNGLFLYQHGRIMLGLKQTAAAMSDVQRALAIEPRLVMGHLFLAQIHERDLEWDQAAEHFTHVLESDDHNLFALSGLADVRMNQGQAADSARLYAKAIAWNSTHLDWWLRLGSLYETNLKNSELALETYKGLRAALDKGLIQKSPADIDLNATIKRLEASVSETRLPASHETKSQPSTGSKK